MTSRPRSFRPSRPEVSNLSATSTFMGAPSNQVDEQAVPQLRLEPGGLGRHDAAGIGNGHQVGDRDREHRERHGGAAAVHRLLERPGAARAADKVDPLVAADVAEDRKRTRLNSSHGYISY